MDTISREQAMDILRDAMVAHLGLVSEGEPYVTPMSFIVQDERILFRTQPGRKLRAIRENPRVCIEVSRFDDESGDWVSVIVLGTAAESKDRQTGELAVQMLLQKYSKALGSPLNRGGLQPVPGLPHVIEVAIEEVTGVSSGGGFTARTRPGRL